MKFMEFYGIKRSNKISNDNNYILSLWLIYILIVSMILYIENCFYEVNFIINGKI